MDQCEYLGCWYNQDGRCKYLDSPLQFPSVRACHDIDIRGDMGEPGDE